MKKRNNYLKIEEKLDLFIEYTNKTGQPIKANTVYKGYPLGVMLTMLRKKIFDREANYSEEIIDRLKAHGFLEKKKMTINERADRLIKFCEENEELWGLKAIQREGYLEKIKDAEERKRVEEQLGIALKDYEYISNRHVKGKVKPELLDKLHRSKVGKALGLNDDLKELAKKCGIPARDIKSIIMNYGSLEEFQNTYLDYIFSGKAMPAKLSEYVNRLRDKIIVGFDFSSPDLISRKPGINEVAIRAVEMNKNGLLPNYKPKGFVFVDQAKITSAIDRIKNEPGKAIKARFGIEEDGEMKSLSEAAGKLNKSYKSVGILASRGILGPSVSVAVEDLQPNDEIKERFVREYVKRYGLFVTEEPQEISQEDREYFMNLYESGRTDRQRAQDKIEMIGFSTHLYNALKSNGIETLNDIVTRFKNREDLDSLYMVGGKIQNELIETVHQQGLGFEWEKDGIETITGNKKLGSDTELEGLIEELQEAYHILTTSTEKANQYRGKIKRRYKGSAKKGDSR